MSVVLPPSETRKTVRMGLVLSGFLVAFGFITLLVPIALYHAAQVAAALRLRTAYTWLALVILSTLFLGVLLVSEALIFGGLVGILWFPIFAFALHQRKNQGRLLWTALLFFLPLVGVIAVALLLPQELMFEQVLWNRLEEMKSLVATDPSLQGLKDPQQTMAFLEQSFQQFRLSAEFRFLDSFLRLEPFQRVAWFIFDSQAAMLFVFGILINTFASLLFLDHAFEQVEKIQSVARYVAERPTLFPAELVDSLSRFPTGDEGEQPVRVVSHSHASALSAAAAGRAQASRPWYAAVFEYFWRSSVQLYSFDLADYRFQVDESNKSRWWLRGFAMPFWMPALGCLVLAVLVWRSGSPEAVIARAGDLPTLQAGLVAFGSLFGMFCLSLTAVQGLLTLYARLTPLAMALFVLATLVVALSASLNVYLIVGTLAVVGLLDYAYDLRGRLASRQKKA